MIYVISGTNSTCMQCCFFVVCDFFIFVLFLMKRVELHVFFVPDDQYDRRLNKVSAEAVDTFISAGFIRLVTLSNGSLRLQVSRFTFVNFILFIIIIVLLLLTTNKLQSLNSKNVKGNIPTHCFNQQKDVRIYINHICDNLPGLT